MPPRMPLQRGMEILISQFHTELIYSFILIICSLMIYFGTKELYELTKHKGIKYFRLAFLFFAIAFFFRSSIKYLLLFFEIKDIIHLTPKFIGLATSFIFLYASSMAIFYLFYSATWKKTKNKFININAFHGIAIILAFLTLLTNNLIFLIIQIILFAFLAIASYTLHNSKNKKNSIHTTYSLITIFWVLNILDLFTPNYIQNFQITINLISIFLFMLILYKVLKTSGGN